MTRSCKAKTERADVTAVMEKIKFLREDALRFRDLLGDMVQRIDAIESEIHRLLTELEEHGNAKQ